MEHGDAAGNGHEILTPCVKRCRLDASGLCVGCRRSVEEIMRWSEMSPAERMRCMRDELPARWSDS